MLPLSKVNVKYAESIEPGELAYLHEIKRYALVGNTGGFTLQKVLDFEENFKISETKDNFGLATSFLDWEIEIDPLSLVRLDGEYNRNLLLTVSGDQLGVISEQAQGGGYSNFVFKRGSPGEYTRAYTRWRIIVRNGDDIQELFVRDSIDKS